MRQNAAVTPQTAPVTVRGRVGNFLAGANAAKRGEIVEDIERSCALWADGLGLFRRKMRMAARLFQVADFRHVETIAATKSSGKVSPQLVKELLSSGGPRYDVAAF